MEDIEQKLNSDNVFLQSQSVSALYQSIVEDAKNSDDGVYENPKVKKLWQLANEGGPVIATLAVESLLDFVRRGQLPAPATLQNFVADVTLAKSPSAIVQGVTRILLLLCEAADSDAKDAFCCPFTGPPKGAVNPYVLLISRRPDLSPAVLEELQFLLNHPNPRVQKGWESFVKPLLYYCFSLTDNCSVAAFPLLNILVSNHKTLGSSLIRLLSNLVTHIKIETKSHLERKVAVILSLSTIGLETKNVRLLASLLPCLIMCLPLCLIHDLATRSIEAKLLVIAQQFNQGCDVTVCALAETIPLTAGDLQLNLLRVGATLLSHKDGNPIVSSRLMPSLLQILSVPPKAPNEHFSAASALVSLIQSTPAQISTNAQLSGNEYWEVLNMSFTDLATFVPCVDLCNQIVRDEQLAADWLEKLANTDDLISQFHYSAVNAVFLYQGSTSEVVLDCTKVFQKEVMKNKDLALELFPIILYRLGREQSPTTRLHLLHLIPSLAVNKLCVSMILKTLLALWTSAQLKPIVLRLLFDVWKLEPRVYSYLSKLINDKTTTSRELEIAKAFVVSSICKEKPSQHGEELLSLLSGFLNENKGKDGTAQTIIALNGIYDLCSAAVIDVRTTWRVIAPKLVKDKRPEVIVKLCELLSLVPKLPIQSAEWEDFAKSVCSILWGWAAGKIKNTVNEAALKSLEHFDVVIFNLKMLPAYAKEGHKLPEKMAATPFEAARNPEDVLPYVPGLAWVKLCCGCSKGISKYVQTYLNKVVEKEVMGLPKGTYMTAIQEAKRRGHKGVGGQPEPPSYTFLPDTSILKAFVIFLQDFSKLLNETQDTDSLFQGVNIVLNALGQPLHRPFPALDWSFLNEVYNAALKFDESKNETQKKTPSIRISIFRVTAQQCNKSTSALSIISKWLTSEKLTEKDQLNLFSVLDQLGRGLNPPTIMTFLSSVFKEALNNKSHLKLLLVAIKPHLTCDYVQDSNRNVMSNAVESLDGKIDPTDSVYDSYKSCVADLPLKHIERLTSPSLWWEVTDEKLYRASLLRCHVACKEPDRNALPWLNDLVDSAAALPGDRTQFLRIVGETLVVRSDAQESSTWFLSLLGRLKEILKVTPADNLVATHEHQQKIVFYFDLIVLGLIIWSGIWSTSSIEKLAASEVLRANLLNCSLVVVNGRSDWAHALPQLLNWFISTRFKLESRYALHEAILLLAAMSNNISQNMWNKVIAMSL